MLYLVRRVYLVLLTLLLTPFLAVLSATLLFFNLIHLLTRFTRKRMPAGGPLRSSLVSIVILSWNGKDLLAQGLPSVVDAVRLDGRDHEILVVDNGSTDGSVDFVRQNFPRVRILPLPENLGFAEGNNAGVRAARHDIVILLNNDMIVDPGFLRPLLEAFGPATFAVSSQIFPQDPAVRREETGKTSATFRRGMVDFSHSELEGRLLLRPHYPTFWAGGGSSAFHRERFLMLGGFQEIYSPAYVEDTDISYQAWKMGWEVLFAPASVVYHKHRASSSRRFSHHDLQILIQRNQFFFAWKNLRSWRLLFSHCFFLPWNCYRLARDSGLFLWKSLFQAAAGLASVEIARLGSPFRGVRSDEEIFNLFANPALYFAGQRQALAAGTDRRMGSSHALRRGVEIAASPRVLWLTAYVPHVGRHAGAGRMLQLLKRLAQRYQITLITFLENDEERDFLPDLEALCERVIAVRRVRPVRWQPFAYEPFEEFRTPEMAAAVRDCLEDQDFDLIQLEYTQMACYARKNLAVKTLLTKHEVDFAACLRRMKIETSPWRKVRWFYNYLQVLDREARLARRVDAVVCMTEPDARELRKFCRRVPIHVINTGVDLDYFRPPAVQPVDPRLVFVGFFQHLPNVDAMIYFCRDILPRIRAQVRETELLVVGSGPPPEILDLAHIPGVKITGFVPDVRPYMASSSVYVVPMRLGVGIRGKILEAWAMAMPVVATSIACAGLRYEPGKNLLVADDAESFAAHVASLLKDLSRRARLGGEGRDLVEKYYGWDASARELDALYRQYLGLTREEPSLSYGSSQAVRE